MLVIGELFWEGGQGAPTHTRTCSMLLMLTQTHRDTASRQPSICFAGLLTEGVPFLLFSSALADDPVSRWNFSTRPSLPPKVCLNATVPNRTVFYFVYHSRYGIRNIVCNVPLLSKLQFRTSSI